jgi:hypothetical protein
MVPSTPLVEWNGVIVAGGQFSEAGGQSSQSVASWNGSVWESLGGGINGSVYALATYQGDLIAAGNFGQAGGVPVNNIARWDGEQWFPLSSGITGDPAPMSPIVRSMAEYDGELFVVGALQAAGEVDATHAAPLGREELAGRVSQVRLTV